MFEETNQITEKIGEKAGYFISYLFFTTVLYLILIISQSVPEVTGYLLAITITLPVIILSRIIKKWST